MFFPLNKYLNNIIFSCEWKNPIIFASNAGTTGRKLCRVQLDEVVLLDTSIMTSLINIVKVHFVHCTKSVAGLADSYWFLCSTKS